MNGLMKLMSSWAFSLGFFLLMIPAPASFGQEVPSPGKEKDAEVSSGHGRSHPANASGVRPGKRSNSRLLAEPDRRTVQDQVPPFDLEGQYFLGNWGGLRGQIQEDGVQFQMLGVFDVASNFTGGYQNGTFGLYLLNIGASFDTEKLIGLKGGEFFFAFQIANSVGSNGEYVGSYWGFDGIKGDVLQISELNYRQEIIEDVAWVLVGKTDANNIFSNLGPVGNFLNGAASYTSVLDAYMPSYPNQAFGIEWGVRVLDNTEIRMAWMDGSTAGYNSTTGEVGPATGGGWPTGFFTNSSYYFDWEIEQEWTFGNGLVGAVTGGAFLQTGEVAFFGVDSITMPGTGPTASAEDPFGFYLDLRQVIFDPGGNSRPSGSGHGVSLFGQFGWANPGSNEVLYSVMGGVECNGIVPGRPHDSFGALLGFTKFSDNPDIYGTSNIDQSRVSTGGHEIDFEIYYQFQVTPWLSIQPDLQIIGSPSGGSPAVLDTAVVGTLRMLMTF